MKVFLTGATGFLGTHILNQCINNNFQILSLTRQKNIFQNSKNVKWIYSDLTNIKFIINEVNNFNPDIVIHLAWEGIPDYSAEKSLINHYNSINLFNNLLKNKQIKKIICAGSCWEYPQRTGKCKESDIAYPTSYFTWAKISLYEYLKLKCLSNKIDLYWFRIFYLYGPGQRKDSIIPSIVIAFKKNTAPIINNPFYENDFIYVKDAAKMLLKPLLLTVPPGIYNIGTGKTISVIEISRLIEKQILNNNIFTKSIDNKKNINYKTSYFADTAKMIENLKTSYLINIEIGINEYIKSVSKEN